MSASLIVAFIALGAWIYLLGFRGMFWRLRERDDLGNPVPDPSAWPSVVAVVPARDEAELIERSVGSLLAQDYPGDFRIFLIDDQSTYNTAALAVATTRAGCLIVLLGTGPPSGCSG